MAILHKIQFRARQLMDWRLRLSDKAVRKFAKLPIYCQWQKCSPFWQYKVYADICGGSLWRGVKWECGRLKWRFSLLLFTVFRTFYNLHIWPHDSFHVMRLSMTLAIFKVIRLFHIKFLKNGAWYGKSSTNRKSYTSFRLVPLLMTLKYIWRSF